jgi:predicted HTH domain antitoxin/antitoxin (DNA-binding transcriptional repressor) of toxin-antitoxin stability system
MEAIHYIPKTALARQTRKIIQAVQRGQTVVVEHHGQPEAAIMDIMDYYLLRAALRYHRHLPQIEADAGLSAEAVATVETIQEQVNLVIAHYLAGAISLSRAAELLDLPWLDLRTRCLRLDIPLRTDPTNRDEIAGDVENAAAYTNSS